jgi:hypothetical protein
LFGLASASALFVVGVVAVRASKESPQSAREVVADAVRGGELSAPPAAASPTEAPAPPPPPEPVPGQPAQGASGLAEGNLEKTNVKEGKVAKPTDSADSEALMWDAKRASPKQAEKLEKQAAAKEARPSPDPQAAVLTPPKNRGMDTYATSNSAEADELQADRQQKRGSKGPAAGPSADAPSVGGLRASESKRIATNDLDNNNWSNVGAGVAREEQLRRNELEPKAGNKKGDAVDQLNDGTSVPQSMNSGSANNRPSGFGVAAGTGYEPAAKSVADKELAGRSDSKPPPPSAPPPVVQATAAPLAPAPMKSKSSYGLPRSMPSSAAAEDEAVTEVAKKSGDVESVRARNTQVAVEAKLSQARVAGSSGDRRGEVMAALAALNAGATGYSRAEALKRACDGYEALGESDRAQAFCDRLLAEFPSTAAARQVADRRKAQLKPSPAPKKAQQRYEFSDDAEKAKPAEAPAQAY